MIVFIVLVLGLLAVLVLSEIVRVGDTDEMRLLVVTGPKLLVVTTTVDPVLVLGMVLVSVSPLTVLIWLVVDCELVLSELAPDAVESELGEVSGVEELG